MKANDYAAYHTPDLFTHKQRRGGYRGGGRPKIYGEETKPVKIPISRVEEVKAYLRGELDNLDNDDSRVLEQINLLLAQWQQRTAPYMNRSRENQGHMRGACDLLKELQTILEGE